jgi:uncharacterized protein
VCAACSSFQDGERLFKRGEYQSAYEAWKPLAESGDARAQYWVARMYYYAVGPTDDVAIGLDWFRRAANQGHAGAQYELGLHFQQPPKDYRNAAHWFDLAARQGHAGAQLLLAVQYSNGRGVPRDYSKSFELLSLAAKKGVPLAFLNLSGAYSAGEGVQPSIVRAYMWAILAEQNIPLSEDAEAGAFAIMASMKRESLKRSLSKTEIETGERLAREWSSINLQKTR